MSQEMERIGGTSEEDFEDGDEMEMEVKEEEAAAGAEDGGGGFFAQEVSGGDQIQIQRVGTGMGPSRRGRPQEEKERTKLRERQRRAITAKILAGLRRHGNYNLRVRADINDVISALAREAGWVVNPDGTTYPARSSSSSQAQAGRAAVSPVPPMEPSQTPPLRAISSSPGSGLQNCRLKSVYTPPTSSYSARCMESANGNQVLMHARLPELDYAGTPYVPIYVMLPLGIVNEKCELVDPEGLMNELRRLKDINVDGVMVDCWWGIVEAHEPRVYNWDGYKRLFQIVRDLKLKLQVVMSFHECEDNIGGSVHISLPQWVTEIGKSNPDIFFTDKEGRRNCECLSWGVDKERVLRGRTAIEVYFDYMRSFRIEFSEFFEDKIVSQVEVGLGPCGELRYPSFPVKHGWKYPGVGEFQCHDQYLMKSLRKAAEARGHPMWASAPFNAGSYDSQPGDTGFFCDGGEYDNHYGRFFLGWYSRVLVDHADSVLYMAKLAFEDTSIVAKISGVHWWYRTASHAAELTAGFYNPCNRDGYASIASTLKKHGAALVFTCTELHTLNQQLDYPDALADPEGLAWQVLNTAWEVCLPVTSENIHPCFERHCYNKILENAKPRNDPDGKHLSSFTYSRLSPALMERHNFTEFERFVKRMHGEAVLDLQS